MTASVASAVEEIRAEAQQYLSGPHELLIDGGWRSAESGATLESVDPTTETVIASVAAAGAEDVDAAVQAARRALEDPSWSRMRPHARTKMLLAIADALEQHETELGALDTFDNGAPLWLSRAQVGRAIEVFRYYAGWPTKLVGQTLPAEPTQFQYTLREPVGVCAGIIPWNAPLLMAAWKIAPALACGNTVILKPAEQTPLSALRLGQLLLETELPAGVLNILTGYGETAGAALASHPGVDKVAFTGSTVVGKAILAASVGNLKRVTLELGGKSPNIIFADADLPRAAATAASGFLVNSGQVCAAGTRIFVERPAHDEFAERLVSEMKGYTVGDPFASTTKMGPLVSREQLDRVSGYLQLGRQEGASVRAGGAPLEGTGYFVPPTLFDGVDNDMRIAQEEIFGPVGSLISFVDAEDAVLQGNATMYGLAAGVWTRDVSKAHEVARAIKAGSIFVNGYGGSDPVAPFGGYKQSGIGRELGWASLDAYTEIKTVTINL